MKHLLVLTVLALTLLVFTLAAPLPAQDDQPFLRIETGVHTARIKRIDIDATGRFLVTGSHDKTVRVWSLDDGSLLRVLRPPIGKGKEGRIDAVAISPNGEIVAAGGWTSRSGLNTNIYLFDRQTGRLVRRLKRLPNVVTHLVFDHNGQRLATTLGEKNGVQVFRIADGRRLGHDTDYGDDSYGASFDPAGHLVTTSFDGKLRLYDRKLAPVAEVSVPGDNQPFGVAFSPDGGRIAVGYADSTRVDVFSGADLTFRYSTDTQGTNHSLSSVSWSADGYVLFAAGRYDVNGMNPIRRFANASSGTRSGPWRDLDGPRSQVTGLRSLPGGRLVFGSADPAWAVLDEDGRRVLGREPLIADLRGSEHLHVSTNGTEVGFAFDYGKRPALFSLQERRLVLDPPTNNVNLHAPRTKADGVDVAGWQSTTEPRLNGKPLSLETRERSRSLALALNGQGLVLGTESYVRAFGGHGAKRWRIDAPGVAWAVNVTADGRFVVVAFGDGTIRWFRYDNGEELLAFFPHRDGRRWVVWTPSGYYDASVDGEDLIGWHVNNGLDQAADFFSAWHFRDQYRRPDIVDLVLETLDEEEAVRQAGGSDSDVVVPPPPVRKTLPPVVTILEPADGALFSTPTVKIRFNVRSPSGGEVDAVYPLVDGKIIPRARDGLEASRTRDFPRTHEVSVPPRDCTVAIVAEAGGKTSKPAPVRLRWDASDPEVITRLFVLAVGVSSYENSDFNLDYAAKDADDVARTFKGLGRQYASIETTVLKDAAASYVGILDALDALKIKLTKDDVVVLFLAGHGITDGDSYYFLPHNADLDRKYSTLLSQNQIGGVLRDLPGHVLLFLDTCRAGALMASGLAPSEAELRRRVDVTNFVNSMMYSNTGVVVYSASSARQFSLEDAKWENGIFTEVLIEGLNGDADVNRDGKVMTSELEGFLADQVGQRTGGVQVPVMAKPGGVPDFVLVRLR